MLGLLLAACSGPEGNGEPAPGNQPALGTNETPANDYLRYELEYKTDAVVIEDLAAVQAALVSANYELGEFVFAPELVGLSELVVGKATLIAGIGVFRVVARETVADGELVRVEAAPLTDVLENAEIAWRRSFVSAFVKDGIGLGAGESESDHIGKVREPATSYVDGVLHWDGKIGKFDTSLDLKPGPSGLHFDIKSTMTGDVGSVTASFNGNVRGMTHESSLSIVGGAVVGYDEVLYQVDGSVNFEVGGVNVTGEVLLTVPARLTLPIMVGPIPFRIELGSSVELRSNISVENSARFAGSTTFVGDAGVQYRPDTGVKYIASFDAVDPKLARSQQTTSITGGFGTMLNFPELSVGVGLPNIAEGTGFLRFKTESVTNASFSTERDICIEASTNFGASYGGNAKFLGITVFDEEHMLFAKVGPEAHSENCEEADPADPTDPADPADAGAGGAGGD